MKKRVSYNDPVIGVFKGDVGRTLLRENLKLTPGERLEKLERFAAFTAAVREAGRRARRTTARRGSGGDR